MADMRFNYTEMSKASTQIRDTIKTAYVNAGTTLVSDFQAAVSAWEGESKEQMETLITGAVQEYLTKSIPDALEALAKLLDENAKQMHNADTEIASQIPTTLS